jgi:hypothetical protein
METLLHQSDSGKTIKAMLKKGIALLCLRQKKPSFPKREAQKFPLVPIGLVAIS